MRRGRSKGSATQATNGRTDVAGRDAMKADPNLLRRYFPAVILSEIP